MVHQIIRIGTRGSKLAMFQSTMVKEILESRNQNLRVELVEIKTSGDWTPAMGETKLSARDGGKGLFCKEIEQALFDGRIDIGVHSLKDMPAFLPEGLSMDHYLPREDARDVFVSARYASIDDLPQGAVVGTSSVRRQSFLLHKRPDLKVVPFRGNVPTRLEKIANNQVDGTFLAYAGLKRLGLHQESFQVLGFDDMLSACGQGIVAVESRAGDAEVIRALDSLQCAPTSIVAAAERSLLATLDGSCRTPIGGYAEINGTMLSLKAQIGAEDGSQIWAEQGTTTDISVRGAAALGQSLGLKLKSQIPSDLLLEEYECG
tara:strand:+ start:78555 stop:79508 length:954 start_codon:yes stop_codon:yes gene_type:complete